jgi:lysophospholipase L1-like esterase
METLIKKVKVHTSNIFVCNIAKTSRDNEEKSHNFAKHIEAYNHKLHELLDNEEVSLIDLNAYGTSLLLEDGIHLNENGNRILAQLLIEAVKRC